jgi:hypothetical protein
METGLLFKEKQEDSLNQPPSDFVWSIDVDRISYVSDNPQWSFSTSALNKFNAATVYNELVRGDDKRILRFDKKGKHLFHLLIINELTFVKQALIDLLPLITHMLTLYPQLVNQNDNDGHSPLYVVIKYAKQQTLESSCHIIKTLIQFGAKNKYVDQLYPNFLIHAMRRELFSLELINLFLNNRTLENDKFDSTIALIVPILIDPSRIIKDPPTGTVNTVFKLPMIFTNDYYSPKYDILRRHLAENIVVILGCLDYGIAHSPPTPLKIFFEFQHEYSSTEFDSTMDLFDSLTACLEDKYTLLELEQTIMLYRKRFNRYRKIAWKVDEKLLSSWQSFSHKLMNTIKTKGYFGKLGGSSVSPMKLIESYLIVEHIPRNELHSSGSSEKEDVDNDDFVDDMEFN